MTTLEKAIHLIKNNGNCNGIICFTDGYECPCLSRTKVCEKNSNKDRCDTAEMYINQLAKCKEGMRTKLVLENEMDVVEKVWRKVVFEETGDLTLDAMRGITSIFDVYNFNTDIRARIIKAYSKLLKPTNLLPTLNWEDAFEKE